MAIARRGWLAGLGLCATTLLAGCVESMFFHPDRRTYSTPQQLGIDAQDVFFDSGGERLHGWWMPANGASRATLVHAHGNAANLSHHAPLVAWLPAAGIDVLSFDYRGFGRSAGSPSLDGVVDDTLAAMAEARSRAAPNAALLLLGQSLGGATAIRASAHDAAAGLRLLIVDSAFASYRGIARDAGGSVLSLVAPLALSSLPDASRDPQAAIARLRAPVLLLHGERDSIIPIQHSERLHAAARSAKQFVRIPGGQHLDALSRHEVRRQVLASIAAAL